MTHPVPLRDQGTWAPRLIVPAGLLARKPRSASREAAAAFPVPALTADYHDHDWPVQVRALIANRGGDVAASAVPGGAARTIEAVADDGRLATITSDPPGQRRGLRKFRPAVVADTRLAV